MTKSIGREEPKEEPGKAQTPLLLPLAGSPSEIRRGDNRERKSPHHIWRRREGPKPNTWEEDASGKHTESDTATTHRAKKKRTKKQSKTRNRKRKEKKRKFSFLNFT
jgi:hypothetical protein